jgi:4-amino-4-deoxy-L-arabinose transferase-like glycosyltransferase
MLTHQNYKNAVIPILWLLAMVMYVIAAIRLDRTIPENAQVRPDASRFLTKHGLIIPIILIAFAMRMYRLESLPPLHGDEGEMGLAALRVLARDAPPITAVGWSDHPAFFHYLQALPVAVLGRTGLALRILSAAAGVLCIPLVYAIGRRCWGPVAGLSAAWLLAFSHLHIHFSRIGLNNIDSTLAMLLFLLLLTRIRSQRVTLFALSGLVVGLAQYLYYGSRAIPLVAIAILFFCWKKKMADYRQLAAFALGTVIAAAPLGAFYMTRSVTFFSRSQAVFVLSEVNVKHTLQSEEASLPEDAWPLLKEQVERNLGFFVRDGDRSNFYSLSVPGFDALTSVFFWLGLGLALTRFRRYHEFSLLSWFSLMVLIGGILTRDSPNAPRLLVVSPAVALLGGLFIQHGVRLLAAYPQKIKTLSLIVVFMLIGLLNVKIYFFDSIQDFPPRSLRSDLIAREIRSAGEEYEVLLMGQPHLYANYGTIHFLAGEKVQDLENPEAIPQPREKALLFIALPNHAETLQEIKQRLPGGESFTRMDSKNNPIYMVYRIPTGMTEKNRHE